MRRRVLPIAAVVAVVASALTGCAAAEPTVNCDPALGSGALSDSVRISGDSADTLQVKLAKGLEASNAQRSIVPLESDASISPEAGEPGAVIEAGMIFKANLAYVDSASGEILQVDPAFGTDAGTPYLADPESGTIFQGVLCAAAGETVAIVYSLEESQAMGVQSQVIALAEITDASAARAVGAKQSLPSGYPAVTNDETGRPGVVLPPQQAPTSTKSAARIVGSGDEVTADQNVIGHVLTVSWDGEELKNTWAELPEGFGNEDQAAQTGASFRAALTGYPVGSQVVVIEAGDGQPRVSVVDILAVV